MRFAALDFETANRKRGSVCQVGLAIFEEGALLDSKSWLVKPYNNHFDDVNVHVHGISERDVAGAPDWEQVWPEVKEHLHGSLVVAHNASFDISVLRHALDVYSIPYPALDYICSYRFAQKMWCDLFSYKLSYLAALFDIELNHHDAHSDAIAAGRVLLKGMEELKVSTYEDLRDVLSLKPGSVFEGGYTTPSIGGVVQKAATNLQLSSAFDGANTFKGKTVAFTGALGYISRNKAQDLVKCCGGQIKGSVSRKVDILVVGETDIRKYGENYRTGKLRRAEQLQQSGHRIRLVYEKEFLQFCRWAEGKPV